MQSPWPLGVVALTHAACGSAVWRRAGARGVTVFVKATFGLVPEAAARLVAPVDLVREDRLGSGMQSLEAASEITPYLPSAGVVLTGHAHAPAGRPAPAVSIRLCVFRDRPLLDKTLHVLGYRTPTSPKPVPFQDVPIVYERAYGGPGVEDNPAGTGVAPGSAPPNIVDPADARRPAGLGPIARRWGQRRRMLGAVDAAMIDRPLPEIPEGFDWRYFNAAPVDQQIEPLRGDEWIILDGMHPTLARVQSRLPSPRAEVRWYPIGGGVLGPGRPIELRADTLVIDARALTASIVWRGQLMLDQMDGGVAATDPWGVLGRMRALAGVEMPGYPIPWPRPEDLARVLAAPPSAPMAAPNVGAASGPHTPGPAERAPVSPPSAPMAPVSPPSAPMAPVSPPSAPMAPVLLPGVPLAPPSAPMMPQSGPSSVKRHDAQVQDFDTEEAPDDPGATGRIDIRKLRDAGLPFQKTDRPRVDEPRPATQAASSALPFKPSGQGPSGFHAAKVAPSALVNPALMAALPPKDDGTPLWQTPAARGPAQTLPDGDRLPEGLPDEPRLETQAVNVRDLVARAGANAPFALAAPGARSDAPRAAIPGAPWSQAQGASPPAAELPMASAGLPPPMMNAGVAPPVMNAGPPPMMSAGVVAPPPPAPAAPAASSSPWAKGASSAPSFMAAPPAAPPQTIGELSAAPSNIVDRVSPPSYAVDPVLPPSTIGDPVSTPLTIGDRSAPPMMAQPPMMAPPMMMTPPDPSSAQAPPEPPRLMTPPEPPRSVAPEPPAPADPSRDEGARPAAATVKAVRAGGGAIREKLTAALAAGEPLDAIDLAGADLSELDLKGAALGGKNLRGANLRRANLSNASLAGATLVEADLTEAVLSGADLSKADLSRVRGASAVFDGAKLAEVVAEGAELERASFNRVTAEGSSWERAALVGTTWAGAKLQGVNLGRATVDRADFSGADLSDAKAQRMSGEGVTLARAKLEGADLRRASLPGASLEDAVLSKAQADKADLSGARLTRVDLRGTSLRGATLKGAVLAHALLDGADLRDVDLERANLFEADRKNAKMNGANLKDVREVDPRDA